MYKGFNVSWGWRLKLIEQYDRNLLGQGHKKGFIEKNDVHRHQQIIRLTRDTSRRAQCKLMHETRTRESMI